MDALATVQTDLAEDLVQFGAQQQGKISKARGKRYAGPISMKGRRCEQVKRHVANLALNRLCAKKEKPTEVQMGMIGSTFLMSTNTGKSEQALYDQMKAAGGPHPYITGEAAKTPAFDRDTDRPIRYTSKIEAALAGNRHWQQPDAVGENPEDIARTTAVLDALRSSDVGQFDPDKPDEIAKQKAEMKEKPAPRVYVVKHSETGTIPDKHAEKHQSDFRAQNLSEFEGPLSSPPVGPKTPCLGCDTYLHVHHPVMADQHGLSGAYFTRSSPIVTDTELARAKETVATRPATGSISQNGYQRNSDYPDSDTDDEGHVVWPRPHGYQVSAGEKPPQTMLLDTRDKVEEVPRSWKRPKDKEEEKKTKNNRIV